MQTLKDRLTRLKEASAAKFDPDILSVFARTTQELKDSGLAAKAPAIGSTLPAFTLPNTDGTVISSKDLLKQGPLVISFYRGLW